MMDGASRGFPTLSPGQAREAQQWALNIHLARIGAIASAIVPRGRDRRQRTPKEENTARNRRKMARASRKANRGK